MGALSCPVKVPRAQAQPRPGKDPNYRPTMESCCVARTQADGQANSKRREASGQASQARERIPSSFLFRASCARPRRALRGPARDDDRSRNMTRQKKVLDCPRPRSVGSRNKVPSFQTPAPSRTSACDRSSSSRNSIGEQFIAGLVRACGRDIQWGEGAKFQAGCGISDTAFLQHKGNRARKKIK